MRRRVMVEGAVKSVASTGSQIQKPADLKIPGTEHLTTSEQQFLGQFAGLLQTDGYAAYDQIGGPKIVHACCWSHAERYFSEAVQFLELDELPKRILFIGGGYIAFEFAHVATRTGAQVTIVLQEREFERVGGTQPVSVDVRVIAATNRDLTSAVAEGRFRQDLFYRLNVFPIRLPALRERISDISLLVGYLIDRYAQKLGKKMRNIDKKTMELFHAYDWPGNIRELQNVVERAVILSEGETFFVDETWLTHMTPKLAATTAPLIADLAEHEREILEAALRESKGVVGGPTGAAVKLGIPRQTLESKIRKLGINRHRFKAS